MKALMLMTGSGPMLVLTSSDRLDDEVFVGKLKAKGVDRFIAYELDLDEVKERYGGHFQTVVHDLHESDDLRVLDVNGHRIFEFFHLDRLGQAFVFEPTGKKTKVYLD